MLLIHTLHASLLQFLLGECVCNPGLSWLVCQCLAVAGKYLVSIEQRCLLELQLVVRSTEHCELDLQCVDICGQRRNHKLIRVQVGRFFNQVV